MFRWMGGAAVGFALTHAAPALATYSIVGADRTTREVGGAGTSCLGGADVYIIYAARPGYGAVHAQARANQAGRDRAAMLLAEGTAPQAILDEITSPDFDGAAASRQYGIVDVTGRSAGFTGSATLAYADDRQGAIGELAYSVQGNILTSEAVLTQAAAAFEGGGCDLAERLMLALEAGGAGGEGDSRCTPDGIPADSAFLQVEHPDRALGDHVSLRVRSSGSDNPLVALRALFDEWRLENPCPGGAGAGGSSGAGGATSGGAPSGGASSGGASSGGASSGGASSGGASSGGASSGGASSGGAPSSGGASSGGSSAGGAPAGGSDAGANPAAGAAGVTRASDDEDSGGCGCRMAAPAAARPWLSALLVLTTARLRRRRARS